MAISTDQTTTIPTPVSLTSSSTTLPTETQRALISHLRATSSLPELSNLLSDSLARTGWTDRVRALALELLRNGTCDTFPELINEVMRRARIPRPSDLSTDSDGANGAKHNATGGGTNGTSTPTTNGANTASSISVSKEWSSGPDGLPDVRIPEVTVESGVEFLKEKIKDVVEAVDDSEDDDSE